MIKTVSWEKNRLKLIDQTRLPDKLVYLHCSSVHQVWEAIRMLRVRGAPAIGVAAAFGVVVGTQNSRAKTRDAFIGQAKKLTAYLASARPTAVNLFWALERMTVALESSAEQDVSRLKGILIAEARTILKEDIVTCREIGSNGARLLRSGDTVLTHCNAGALATGGSGTALSCIYEAVKQGKSIKVYADETRPLLQGARLTTWELMKGKVPVTLVCDNTAGYLMKQGRINKVIVGADRIAANGDTANKIGTYSVAVLANAHRIPFYVAAPKSTFDLTLPTGTRIPIEQRNPDEVRGFAGKITAPAGTDVYNPAFDVTPARLVTAFITERGVFRKPYVKSLRGLQAA